jgi:hypothetical protein
MMDDEQYYELLLQLVLSPMKAKGG